MRALLEKLVSGDRVHGLVLLIVGILAFFFRSAGVKQIKTFNSQFKSADQPDGPFIELSPKLVPLVFICFGIRNPLRSEVVSFSKSPLYTLAEELADWKNIVYLLRKVI